MKSPLLAAWRADLLGGVIEPDDAQLQVLQVMDGIWQALEHSRERKRGLGDLLNLFQPEKPRWPPVKGLYLWGDVGRGKTYLLDLFYRTWEEEAKARYHFHAFMRHVHAQLRQRQGERDPLQSLARDFAVQIRLLLLDEFLVHDIADAMILGELLEALFLQGVCLLTSSNTAPENLYAGGLQRQRFLPAIDTLKAHTHVLRLDGAVDHRRQRLSAQRRWLYPLSEHTASLLLQSFNELLPGGWRQNQELCINGRLMVCARAGGSTVWFAFADLCEQPLGAGDYLELARNFSVWFIEGIPEMDARNDDAARRFITLVDVLYDQQVKLVASACCPPDELYRGQRLKAEFQRTASRLVEMQGDDWWQKPR